MRQSGRKELIVIATPDDEALAKIIEVQRLATGYFSWPRPQKPETLHMTICPLGEWDGSAEQMDRARWACAQVHASCSTTTLDQKISFKGGRQWPYVLAASETHPELVSINYQIVDALRAKKVRYLRKGVKAHVTLNWGFDEQLESPLKQPIEWRTRGIDLIISHIGQARHTLVERWLFSD